MTFPGLKDPKQIDDIVAYLKQFDSTGKKQGRDCPCPKKIRKGAVESMRLACNSSCSMITVFRGTRA